MAIEAAVQQQIEIVDACFEIISKKLVKSCADFRYAILHYEDFSAKLHLSYLTLEKIANLLINIYSAQFTRRS